MSKSNVRETHTLDTSHQELRYSQFSVTVLDGPDAGLTTVSSREELSIGTAAGNDLVLRDPSVSRHHCTFVATATGVNLRDLRSTNGTWVGALRADAVVLPRSATVRVGETTLRFEITGEEMRERLSAEDRYGSILGRSASMRRVFALLPRLAESEATILLEGETGTGKGLIAETIHKASPRAKGPFVVVDCSTIPPSLVESELFGHEKGSFTGATGLRIGAFEAARGGTVFLDEIGELPLDMQPKLLRALEERTIKRIGSTEPTRLDVRVIAATNRDLRQEVNRGAFRADAYFRLNTVCLRIPALRERREDIPDLIAHFYGGFRGDPRARPPAAMISAFIRRDWPGNVRELRSAIERAVLLGDLDASASPTATLVQAHGHAHGQGHAAAHPAFEFDEDTPFRVLKERMIEGWERRYLEELVRRHGTNLSRAARAARTDRNYLRELLRKYKIGVSDE